MSAERKRTLIHATMAAVVLAVVGMMYAELATIWAGGQSVSRDGQPITTEPPDVAGKLRWRLPVAMGLAGFAFVTVGETLRSAWGPPAAAKPAVNRDFDREAEAKIQQLLKEAEANTTTGDPTERGASAP